MLRAKSIPNAVHAFAKAFGVHGRPRVAFFGEGELTAKSCVAFCTVNEVRYFQAHIMKRKFFWFGASFTMMFTIFAQDRSSSPPAADFDVIIKGGTIYDGTGAEP